MATDRLPSLLHSRSHARSLLRLAALIWALVVAGLVLLAGQQLASGPRFDTSLMALLPEDRRDPLLQMATDRLTDGGSRKLILLVSAEDDEQARDAVAVLANRLQSTASVASLIWQSHGPSLTQSPLYASHRFALLDPQARAELLSGQLQRLSQRALGNWYGPMGLGALGANMLVDPFLLSRTGLDAAAHAINVRPDRSLLRVTTLDQPGYLLIAELGEDPFDLTAQQDLRRVLDQVQGGAEFSGVQLQLSGLFVHAEAGARQASQEISTVGLGSLVGIVLLMFWVFRSIRPLLLVLLSVGVGCSVAAAITLLVFDRVHLITLAFGAGLVGVSVDYGLHFLCECHQRGDPYRSLRAIIVGLGLGLLSSVLAYSAQSLAPFPGLRQMALFSSAGLIGSWLTVVLWLPLLAGQYKSRGLIAAQNLSRLLSAMPRLQTHRSAQLLVAAVALLSIWGLFNIKANDDVRLLQTSPAELLQQEQRLQLLLGHHSSSVFLLLDTDALESLLQREEALRVHLDALVNSGALSSYQSLSAQLPSVQRQQQNLALITQLYQQQLPALFQTLGLGPAAVAKAAKALETQGENSLSVETWLNDSASEPYRHLLLPQRPGYAGSIIRLGAVDAATRVQLQQLVDTLPGVRLVDQVENLSQLLGYYRDQILAWVGAAYLLLIVILCFRYRRESWRIIVPPALASSAALSLIFLLEGGVNLFHLLALLLVLGIGLDMGIFLRESGQRAHTWLAVCLAAATSILGFGLLTLSRTPVLHHFGLTVLLGLTLIFVLATLCRAADAERGSGDSEA